MKNQDAIFKYCLRLGDDALVLGHRLSEWCSKAPLLEEDLALTNLSLDMIGRAQAILKYAGEVEGKGRAEDEIAYSRSERAFRNHLLFEQPNGDFAHTIARQLYGSVFEFYFYTELQKSSDATLSAIAAKTLKEVKYHVEHASDWTIRLGDGTEKSKMKMQNALDDLWMYTGELFEMNDVDRSLLSDKISVDTSSLKGQWLGQIKTVLDKANLRLPSDTFMQTGGLNGVHTEHLGHILSEMQYLHHAHPGAKW